MAEDGHTNWEDFYLGSRAFQFLADAAGMPIDQVNFLLGQAMALIMAYIFRVYLHPMKVSETTRHWGSFLAGLGICYFCYGRQVLLALLLVLGCYLLLLFVPATIIHRVMLVFALTFLSVMHLERQFYEDGVFVLDVTGPLMIIVQKVTALAYSFHDGVTKKEEDLTQLQKEMVIRKKPSLLEFLAYTMNFHSLNAGPFFMFADYEDFIKGTHYAKRSLNIKGCLDSNRNNAIDEDKVKVLDPSEEPDPTSASLFKTVLGIICALNTVLLIPYFPIGFLAEKAFFKSSFIYQTFYYCMSTTLTRNLYYTGWLLGDGICNMSGLGFNGIGSDGLAKWDLVTNVDVWGCETALTFRDVLDNWNMGTMRWLRFMVYERATHARTLATYCLSSMWHGFYPGYYVTFVGGAFFTIAARSVRRSVRPKVLQMGPHVKRVYDILTCLTTRVMVGYLTLPFVLLRFWPSIDVYKNQYFFLHILGILAIYVLPIVMPPPRKHDSKTSTASVNTNTTVSENTVCEDVSSTTHTKLE